MKKPFIRIFNALLIIVSELLIFLPSRIILNLIQATYNILHTLGRYLVVCENPTDGTHVIPFILQLKIYAASYYYTVLASVGLNPETSTEVPENEESPTKPFMPCDY